MIGDPVALTLHGRPARLGDELLAPFRGVPTGFVVDAQDGRGALCHDIKPLTSGAGFAGPAVTALGGPRDNLAALALLDHIEPGDVLVIATGADRSGAVIGDNWAALARARGAAALVTDGLVRDARGIRRTGLPVFAAGTVPNAGYPNGPGVVNGPVALSGTIIHPGDVVIGDEDGVVVVPAAGIEAVVTALEEIKRREADLEATIAAGTVTSLAPPGRIAEGRIRTLP